MVDIKVSHNIKIDKDGNFVHSKPKIRGNKDLVKNILNATTYTIKNDKHQFQYHGMANSMPKRLKEYFENIGVKFDDDEMVDVIEYVEFELVNRWKKG